MIQTRRVVATPMNVATPVNVVASGRWLLASVEMPVPVSQIEVANV